MSRKPPGPARRYPMSKALTRARKHGRPHPPRIPVMKRYTVECQDCNRQYELDFTGPVKFCSFCRSANIKAKHRPAPPQNLLGHMIQGLFVGFGVKIANHYISKFEDK